MEKLLGAVVAGHICLDIIPGMRTLPPGGFQEIFLPGHLLEVGAAALCTGEVVPNTGLALHRLGIPTQLICKVGADAFGRIVRDLIDSYGSGLAAGIVVDPQAATSYSMIISPPDMDRIVLHNPAANHTFSADDIDYQLVGRAAGLPAANASWGADWQGDDYMLWVEGGLRESVVFGENLLLRRRIWVKLDAARLWIEDKVENQVSKPSPHMFLQHFNLGSPLVGSTARLILPEHTTLPRDENVAAGLADCLSFSDPVADYAEQVFYHDLSTDADGRVEVSLVNSAFNGRQGLDLALRYSKNQYPVFVEWKMMRAGTYVVGLEPSNCRVEGRAVERAAGRLQFLQPGEVRCYAIEVVFFEPGRAA